MKTAKSTTSTSPPRRRPAKIGESCDNCGISKVKCGRQQPKCLPCLETGLAYSYSLSKKAATPSQAYPGTEPLRSSTTAEASFDPFHPLSPSTINLNSSPTISFQHNTNRSRSGSQAMDWSSTEHIRARYTPVSGKHMNGHGKTNSSAHSIHDFPQYINEDGASDFRNETVSDTRGHKFNRAVFDLMGEENSCSDSAVGSSVQDHGTFGNKLPLIAGFDSDLNGDFDFDELCRTLTPSAFLACMPRDSFDLSQEQDANILGQNPDGFSAGANDDIPGIFAPMPKYGLDIRKPRDTVMGMEACSDDRRTCMISALNILQALHIPPPACLWACDETFPPRPRQPRMIDTVLSTNRDVVRAISEMLKCICSLSSQVQLVLTTICGKLMAWYRAMIRNDCDDYSNSPPRVRSIVSNNMNDNDQTERVLHQPITVGEYSFDVALESKIRAQVVFSELQHLEGLVGKLSRRSQEAKFGNLGSASATSSGSATSGSMTPDEVGLAEGIHRRLSMFLHQQLQAAKAETLLS